MKEEDIRKRKIFDRYLELARLDAERLFPDLAKFINVPCPGCGSRGGPAVLVKHRFTYRQCPKCNTLYVDPRPNFADLSNLYKGSTSTTYWINEFFLPVAEVRREKIFKPRANYVATKFSGIGKGVVGDIGAGFGIFIEELRNLWPHASFVAIEPSQQMAQICRSKKIEVIEASLEEVKVSEGQFDLLTCFELLEHLYDPRTFIEMVFKLLKPKGFFYFTTLNGLGFDIQVLWMDSKSLSPPHHLNLLNPRSASILLESVGFRVVDCSTPGMLDWDIVEGAHLNDGAEIGKLWSAVSRFGDRRVKDRLQEWIQESNLSSHMRLVAQKV